MKNFETLPNWLKENDLNLLEWFDETIPIPDDQIKEVAKKLENEFPNNFKFLLSISYWI